MYKDTFRRLARIFNHKEVEYSQIGEVFIFIHCGVTYIISAREASQLDENTFDANDYKELIVKEAQILKKLIEY